MGEEKNTEKILSGVIRQFPFLNNSMAKLCLGFAELHQSLRQMHKCMINRISQVRVTTVQEFNTKVKYWIYFSRRNTHFVFPIYVLKLKKARVFPILIFFTLITFPS